MVVEVFLRAMGFRDINYWLLFTPETTFHQWNLWRLFTYPFVNEPSIWFLLEMAMLFYFGREVERSVGRGGILLLYAALLVIPAVAITGLQLFGVPTAGLAGSWNLNFGIFVAFVALYPGLEFFFGIAAKWIALVLIAIHSLELLEGRNWIFLTVFWLECGVAVLVIRAIGSAGLESLLIRARSFWASPPLRKRWKHASSPTTKKEKECDSVDLILEKISRRGIGSLTPRERECLEKARSALLEKERHP